jgi:hypothetical protein
MLQFSKTYESNIKHAMRIFIDDHASGYKYRHLNLVHLFVFTTYKTGFNYYVNKSVQCLYENNNLFLWL